MPVSSRDIIITELKDTVADLRGIILTLQTALSESVAQGKLLSDQNALLTEKIEYLTNKLFGTKSEKAQVDGQLNLFEKEAVPLENNIDSLPPIIIAAHTRKPKTTLEEKIKGLPVEEVICHLKEGECNCPYCNAMMEVIGRKVVRREVELIPQKVKVIEYVSLSYGCPDCKEDGASCIVNAPVPAGLMKHSAASPSTVAWVMYQKYHNGMPLYRQQNDWKHTGFELSRATMANWVIYCAERYLKPIYDYCHRLLVLRKFLMADETRCQILNEPGRKPQTDSYMWAFRSGEDGLPSIILFMYSETRAGINAQKFLEGFHGYLMTDAFSGYNKVPDVKHCPCFAHIRRYFFEAIPKGMENDLTHPAVQGLNYINKLFEYERIFKEQQLSTKQVYENRLKKEKPVLDAFNAWLDKQNPIPGSRFEKAVNYAINRRGTMETYLEDGRCSFSNALTELLMKSFATGRKGWLFSDSVDGANASAITYSLVEMAKASGIHVFEYIKYLLESRPHKDMTDSELEALLPWHPEVVAKCKL
ncbi:MAG: IS66 family transposase [Clostridiales bacterium]|nr:IS66 family transposase [Clostridiales bacterium]